MHFQMGFLFSHFNRTSLTAVFILGGVIASSCAMAAGRAATNGRRPASVSAAHPLSAEDLFRKYKPAVAKIIIKQQNIPVAIGAGFFVSKDGTLVTNHHVMRSAISNPGFSVEFTLGDGTIVKSFQVHNCGDSRNLDVCLLKLNVKPKSFFPLAQVQASPGETVYVIGHPRGLDFSISNGIVSAVRKSSTGINEVQISAAISPGNSGGPIFNSKGQLVGVATKYLKDGQNLNFGIQASEISRYATANPKPFPVAEANRRIDERVRNEMRKLAAATLKPALNLVAQGKSLAGVKGFKETQLDFDGKPIQFYVPEVFESCVRSENEAEPLVHACFGMGDAVVLSVQRFRLKERGLLLKMNGKTLLEPKPLSVVSSMMQDGSWKPHEKSLSPAQRRTFFSQPGPAECQKMRASSNPEALFNNVPACRFMVKGDTEPEAVSSSVWLEKDSYLYGFTVWMSEPALGEFFNQVPTISILTATQSGSAKGVRRTVASSPNQAAGFYQITPPQGVEFIKATRRPDGSQYDLYAKKKLIGIPDDSYALVVDRLQAKFQPTDFEKASRQLFETMSKLLKARPKQGTVEVETGELDGMPGRLISGFANSEGREVLILALLAFGPNETYVVAQISDAKNPPDRFREFKTLTSTFKKK